jgi:hypothetical protein
MYALAYVSAALLGAVMFWVGLAVGVLLVLLAFVSE